MREPLTHDGHVNFRGHHTWYRVTGDLTAGATPVVVAHGGPGSTHESVLPFAGLAASGRAVVLYDQLGNGNSSRISGAPAGFWGVGVFRAELENLLRELGIDGRYHLVGHSWGGMLAAEHAVSAPPGLRSLVLVSAPASVELLEAEVARLHARQPAHIQRALRAQGSPAAQEPEHEQALREFHARHVCRLPAPWPQELTRSMAASAEDPTVMHAMYGPEPGKVTGALAGWSVVDRLDRVHAPTLLLSGSHEHIGPAAVLPFHQHIPDVRWAVLPDAAHLPHFDSRELCLRFVGDFLAVRD